MKTCRRCLVEKPLDEFSPERANKDGRKSYCRPCMTARACERYATDPEYAERKRAYARARRQDPKVKARISLYNREYRERRPEYTRSRDNDPAKRARDRAWARTEKGRLQNRLAAARRNALKRAADRGFTVDDWREVCADFNDRCAYCLTEGPLELEHMTPLVRGGLHERANIVPACGPCNRRKNTKTLLEFAASAA